MPVLRAERGVGTRGAPAALAVAVESVCHADMEAALTKCRAEIEPLGATSGCCVRRAIPEPSAPDEGLRALRSLREDEGDLLKIVQSCEEFPGGAVVGQTEPSMYFHALMHL